MILEKILRMQTRVCICCGQPMGEGVGFRFSHSHVCPACYALVDDEEPPPPKKKSPPWRVHPVAIHAKLVGPVSEAPRPHLR